jgi:hypothetical protein
MAVFFFLSLTAKSVAGHPANNVDLLHRPEDPTTWLGCVASADFWNRTTQNWQSEFLAVASMAGFAIYLRQRDRRGQGSSVLRTTPLHKTVE